MLADQEYALAQVLDFVRMHSPDAVVIAGDVYDRLTPPPEAVRVLDRFITALAELGPTVMIISGNHDSPERLGFASGIMSGRGVHLYGVFDGAMRVVTLVDEYGEVRFHMLPYIRPADIRLHGQSCESYHEAVTSVIESTEDDASARHVLIAHQFFAPDCAESVSTGAGAHKGLTGTLTDVTDTDVIDTDVIDMEPMRDIDMEPIRSDSERQMIGGIDRVGTSAGGISVKFDYVALGHLHGPQRVGAKNIRYAGSPIKYSFSECYHNKCALLVEMREKGDLTINALPIKPLHDMRRIRGKLEDLLAIGAAQAGTAQAGTAQAGAVQSGVVQEAECAPDSALDYLHVTLTDDGEAPDALGKLRAVYPNVMNLAFDNARSNAEYDFIDGGGDGIESKSPLLLFEEFYIAQNGAELDDDQRDAVAGFLNADGGDSA